MSSDNELGYETDHGPTDTDFTYASLYAQNAIARDTCQLKPDKWQWFEEPCGFPCPFDDRACVCGYCALTQQGCSDYSHYPYFDCKRKEKTCVIDGQSKSCTVCDYSPKLDTHTFGIDTHMADGPYTVDGALDYVNAGSVCDKRNRCYAGDSVDVDCDTAEENELSCAPILERKPYYMLTSLTCTRDKDCKASDDYPNMPGICSNSDTGEASGNCYDIAVCYPDTQDSNVSTVCYLAGLGGLCSSTDVDTAGFCYEQDHYYTEWRKNFQPWADVTPRDVCVVAIPEYRRWCEMPWTRPGGNSPGMSQHASETAEQSFDLNGRIENQWKTRWKQPFYYDPDSGQCYITRDYCTKPINTEGGFDVSYGNQHEYFMFTTCDTSNDFVHSGKDCCSGFLQSLSQFFFGKTLTADFMDVLNGDISVYEFAKISNENYAMVTFFSDRALKRIRRVEVKDFATDRKSVV